jgi:hypothetical protein
VNPFEARDARLGRLSVLFHLANLLERLGFSQASAERTRSNTKGLTGIYLKAKARIWP